RVRAGRATAAHRTRRGVSAPRRIPRLAGALADLGVSSLQFDAAGRGFSFQRDEPLDMRMDQSSGETAADLVAHASERELADAIFQYGEERFSRRVARALVGAPADAPIDPTGRLGAVGAPDIPPARPTGTHHATAT